MKEIRDFLLENMPVPAQRECLHEVYEATNGSEYVMTNMQRPWEAFGAAYLYMERIYRIPIGSNLITEDIVGLDTVRDRILNAVDSIVDAQLKSPNDDVAAAARELAQTKVSFPVNPRAGYLSETGQLDSYLAVMLSEQLENMTKVGVLSPIETLKSINDQIHTLVTERGDENVEKGQDLTRPEARAQAINAWRSLVKYINGYNIVVLGPSGANEQLDRYIDTCNDIADRYRSIYFGGAGNRPSGSESEETEGDGETTPPETGGGSGENTNPGTGGGTELTPDDEQTGNSGNENTNPGGGNGSTGGSGNGNGSTGGSGSNSGVGDPITPGPGGDDDDL